MCIRISSHITANNEVWQNADTRTSGFTATVSIKGSVRFGESDWNLNLKKTFRDVIQQYGLKLSFTITYFFA
jgi:hypothetical protein